MKTIGRNLDIKGDPDGGSEREVSCRENICHLREYMNCHKQNVARNVNVKGASDEAPDRSEERVIEN